MAPTRFSSSSATTKLARFSSTPSTGRSLTFKSFDIDGRSDWFAFLNFIDAPYVRTYRCLTAVRAAALRDGLHCTNENAHEFPVDFRRKLGAIQTGSAQECRRVSGFVNAGGLDRRLGEPNFTEKRQKFILLESAGNAA